MSQSKLRKLLIDELSWKRLVRSILFIYSFFALNAYQDAEAAYTYLTQKLKVPPHKIIVYGRSVGGGSAVDLATRQPIAGLILESTFTSAFRVVVPFPLLPFDKFSNLKKLPQVDCPILVMHAQADQTIPIKHGYKLYETATNPKMSLWVDGAGHDDLIWVADEQHRKTLAAFQQLIKKHK